MKSPFPEPKWLAQGISLMVLGALASIYFFWYVPHQRDYFAKRNFRVLALTSEQIKKTIEAFPGALRIAARSVEKAEVGTEDAQLLARVKKAMVLIPALTLTSEPKVEAPKTLQTNLGVNVRLSGSWVEIEYRNYAGDNTNRLVTIQTKCDLSRIAGSPPEFDGLLIAQEGGEVVFQRLPVGLNIQKLNPPDKEQQNSSGSNLVRRASNLMTASLAGDDYKFFLQPLRLEAPVQQAGANNWLVCGLVRAGRFNSESLEVAYIFLIIFIFLVLFAVLSLVFPSVAFAGPREALRRRTVLVLGLSKLGGAALLTVLLLDMTIYPFIEWKYFNAPTQALAAAIHSNFQEEIHDLYRVTLRLDELSNGPSSSRTNVLTEILTRPDVRNALGESRARFDMAFWVAEDGMQTGKWTVRKTATPLISLRERSYFQDALQDRNTTRTHRERGTNEFWLEPIYSLSSGENSVILSIRSAFGGVAAIESRLQSVLRPVFPSGYGFSVVAVDGQVLFHSDEGRNLRENLFEECDDSTRLRSAVVSRTSQQFDIRYLGRPHNFYVTPVHDLPWTLVVFRDKQLLSAANFELVLVSVFLLVVCFLVPSILLIVLLGVPWLLRLSIGRPIRFSVLPHWLWPDSRRWKAYVGLSVFNFLLAASLVTILSIQFRSPWWVVAYAASGMIAGTVVTFCALARGRSDAPLKGRLAKLYPWSYVTALISLLLVVAVVPAFGSFTIALDQRIQLFVKHGQFNFAKALGERADRLRRDHRDAPGSDDLEARLWLNSEKLPWDVYGAGELIIPQDDGPISIRPEKGRAIERTPFHWLFATITPLRDSASVESRGLLAKRAEDNSWYWSNDPKRGLILHVNNYRQDASLSLATPRIEVPLYTWLSVLAAMSLALLIPICFIAHRVFLINLRREDTSASAVLASEQLPENLLVFSAFSENERPLLDRLESEVAQRRRIDCLEIDCRQETFDAPSNFKEHRHVILDYFEHGWDDPKINRRKLALLDKLTSRSDRCIVICSARDPRQMPIEEEGAVVPDASGGAAPRNNLDPWRELWCAFRWVCLTTPGREVEAGYRAIWANCSKDEQLALFHVAKHGLLHATNPELPFLLGRGLLINEQGLRLRNEGFRRFVCESVNSEDAEAYDQKVAGKSWEVIKGPVYVALIGVALLMFITQPEIYKIVFGIITAFAAGPPAILKLLSMFESDKGKKPAA